MDLLLAGGVIAPASALPCGERKNSAKEGCFRCRVEEDVDVLVVFFTC